MPSARGSYANTRSANTARDLEVFSKHAGRKTINPDDVLLLGRRNEELQAMLEKELEGIRAAEGRKADGQPVARAQPAAASKKRGRPAGTGKGKAKA
jgi:centromere protein S